MKDKKQNTLTMPQAVLAAGILIAIAIFGSGFVSQPSSDLESPNQLAISDNQVDEFALLKNVLPLDKKVDHVRGAEEGSIIIYEYSDIDCPFCGRFHETMMQLVENYPDDVTWVYRHLPLDGLHPEARPKAIAAECAFNQGGDDLFWSVIDVLFAENLTLEKLDSYIEESGGVDMVSYQKCLESEDASDRIDRDVANAIQTLGSADRLSTPWSILQLPDGQFIPIRGAQSYETLAAVVESVINQ